LVRLGCPPVAAFGEAPSKEFLANVNYRRALLYFRLQEPVLDNSDLDCDFACTLALLITRREQDRSVLAIRRPIRRGAYCRSNSMQMSCSRADSLCSISGEMKCVCFTYVALCCIVLRGSVCSPGWPLPRANQVSRSRSRDVASVTVRGYHSDLGQFAVWYDGHPIENLTASDLAHFRQYLSRDRSMKPASVNRKLEALRRFCRWAHTTGKLRTNVAAELKLARAPRGMRPKGLLPAQVQGLLRAAGQSRRTLARRNYAVVQLLLQAGLRVSEAAALRIEDLEIRERQGKVRICGKGNKERYVPLNTTA